MSILQDTISKAMGHGGARLAVKDRNRSLSFFDVERMANEIGKALLRAGVIPGSLVTLHVPKSVDEYVTTIALMQFGYVGLTLAPDASRAQVEYASLQYPVQCQVAHAVFKSMYEGRRELARVGELLVFENARSSHQDAMPEGCAWTLMTSGSTGTQKLVMMTGQSLVERSYGECRDFGISENDKIVSFLNSSHDLGLNQILSSFVSSAPLVVHKLIFMIDFLRLVASEGITGFTAVPSFWQMMMRAKVLPLELPQLRYVTVSGGSLQSFAWNWLRHALPQVDIIKTYGQTETFRSLIQHNPPSQRGEYVDTLGFPVEGVSLTLKEDGELIHRGVGTMLGYFGATLVNSSCGVATGDIFSFDPVVGYRFQGRRDDMMKVNGHRIYPLQLERVLMDHPAVIEAMVMIVGNEDERLVAVVSTPEEVGLSPREVLAFVAERVPRGLVPADVFIRNSFPKTSSGKIDRARLMQEVRQVFELKSNA